MRRLDKMKNHIFGHKYTKIYEDMLVIVMHANEEEDQVKIISFTFEHIGIDVVVHLISFYKGETSVTNC